MDSVRTLCYIIDNDRVLLGKKLKRMGAGNVNGFGGRVEEYETIEAACCREVQEECGVIVLEADLRKRAVLDFRWPEERRDWNQTVHAYVCHRYDDEPVASDEMEPLWLPLQELLTIDKKPIDGVQFWDSDKLWLPHVLAGRTIKGTFHYTVEGKVFNYAIHQNSLLLDTGSFPRL